MRKISIFCGAFLGLFVFIIIGCGEDAEEAEVGDIMPPTVKDVIVAGDTSAAATNGPIIIVFNEAIDPASIQSSVILTPQADGDISYDTETRTLTFDPRLDLQDNTKYSIAISNIANKAGNVMEPFTFEIFASEPDVVPPTVKKTSPEDDESEAPTAPRFVIEFSERIDMTEFKQDISLTPDTGIPVERWICKCSEDGRQVEIFVPIESGLEPKEKFELRIGRDSVVDLVGNRMAESLQIQFTTAERSYEDIDPVSQSALQKEWLYIIWKDRTDIWHITWGGTAPAGATKRGEGTISSNEGEIDDVNSVAWEAGDTFDLRDGRLTFRGPVNGTGGTDGLEFKVNGETVTFRLLNGRAEWIFIGQDRKHPETTTFTLLNE
jgi:hypothetical protein